MNAYFLVIGYAYYWLIVGIDAAPRELPYLGKLGLLLAAMPFHAFFGISLMSSVTVIGGAFYRSWRCRSYLTCWLISAWAEPWRGPWAKSQW